MEFLPVNMQISAYWSVCSGVRSSVLIHMCWISSNGSLSCSSSVLHCGWATSCVFLVFCCCAHVRALCVCEWVSDIIPPEALYIMTSCCATSVRVTTVELQTQECRMLTQFYFTSFNQIDKPLHINCLGLLVIFMLCYRILSTSELHCSVYQTQCW